MYKVLKRTCFAVVLLIKSFASLRSRCRHCRGFLEIPFFSSRGGLGRRKNIDSQFDLLSVFPFHGTVARTTC